MQLTLTLDAIPANRKRERKMLAILEAAGGAWVTSGHLADNGILSASQAYQRLREFGVPVESTGRGGMGRYRII